MNIDILDNADTQDIVDTFELLQDMEANGGRLFLVENATGEFLLGDKIEVIKHTLTVENCNTFLEEKGYDLYDLYEKEELQNYDGSEVAESVDFNPHRDVRDYVIHNYGEDVFNELSASDHDAFTHLILGVPPCELDSEGDLVIDILDLTTSTDEMRPTRYCEMTDLAKMKERFEQKVKEVCPENLPENRKIRRPKPTI